MDASQLFIGDFTRWRAGKKRSMSTALDLNGAEAISTSLKAKRINPTTKKAYVARVKMMADWISRGTPDAVNSDGQLRLPVAKQAVLGFFGHLCEPAHACDTRNVHAEDVPSPPLSYSCVEGYRSALVDLYRANTIELDGELDAELKSVLEGYEKTINDLKRRGLMDIQEGKRHLKSSGYDLIASKLMKQTPEGKGQSWATVVFSWSFFVLQWNLMSRSDSIEKIMLQHIEWSEDALVVEEQGHKGDQTGADKYGKHVYANPYEPNKCPVLALAVLLFSFPERPDGRHQLFVGTDNKGRFGRAIRSVMLQLSDGELQLLGCDSKDIATHSIRKGSGTYALGQINGPNHVSVYLRMGQSLGRLRDRYIHFGEGADQLCGRMVAGLPFDSERFGVLPPHFHPSLSKQMNHNYWQDMVSGFDRYPRAAQTIFPFLLASLVHHEAYLRQHLNEKHPIFTSRAFSKNPLLSQLRSSTILAIGSSSICNLKATGIPPHLAIAAQISKLTTEMSELKQGLEDLPDVIKRAVVDELRESFSINGIVPVSLRDIDVRLESFKAQMIEAMREQSGHAASRNTASEESRDEWATWWTSDGQICHFVPPDWEFPALITVKAAWDLWHFGDKSTGIRPYKMINHHHDINNKHRMRYRRVSAVMSELETIAKNQRLILDGCKVHKLPVTEVDAIFAQCFPLLLAKIYPSKSTIRAGELSCGTLYNKLCVYRKSAQP